MNFGDARACAAAISWLVPRRSPATRCARSTVERGPNGCARGVWYPKRQTVSQGLALHGSTLWCERGVLRILLELCYGTVSRRGARLSARCEVTYTVREKDEKIQILSRR